MMIWLWLNLNHHLIILSKFHSNLLVLVSGVGNRKNNELIKFANPRIDFLEKGKLIENSVIDNIDFLDKLWSEKCKNEHIKYSIEINIDRIRRFNKFVYSKDKDYKLIRQPFYWKLIINDNFRKYEKKRETLLKINTLSKINTVIPYVIFLLLKNF